MSDPLIIEGAPAEGDIHHQGTVVFRPPPDEEEYKFTVDGDLICDSVEVESDYCTIQVTGKVRINGPAKLSKLWCGRDVRIAGTADVWGISAKEDITVKGHLRVRGFIDTGGHLKAASADFYLQATLLALCGVTVEDQFHVAG